MKSVWTYTEYVLQRTRKGDKEMKNWIVILTRGYTEFKFSFEEYDKAMEFIALAVSNKTNDEDYEDDKFKAEIMLEGK